MNHIPKGAFKKNSHNPNARVAQNYSLMEDLSQSPYAMSTMEVLQSCPSQRKALLSSLGATEITNSRMIVFEPTNYKTCLPYHITFQIVVVYATKSLTWNIFSYNG
jgi:hypothetical protein